MAKSGIESFTMIVTPDPVYPSCLVVEWEMVRFVPEGYEPRVHGELTLTGDVQLSDCLSLLAAAFKRLGKR